jgi:hypothetical protein
MLQAEKSRIPFQIREGARGNKLQVGVTRLCTGKWNISTRSLLSLSYHGSSSLLNAVHFL